MIPDPALIFDYRKDARTMSIPLKANYIQPAFNGKPSINLNRYKGPENLKKLKSFADTNKLKAMPHSVKDFQTFDHFILPYPMYFFSSITPLLHQNEDSAIITVATCYLSFGLVY